MKKPFNIFLLVLPMALMGRAYAQTIGENYIMSVTAQKKLASLDHASEEAVNTAINFYDGLGRLKQTISREASPTKKDIITHITYDIFGNKNKDHLPFTRLNYGAYVHDPDQSIQLSFYINPPDGVASSSYPYAEIEYEPSPLKRVTQRGAPGDNWQLDGDHTVQYEYLVNNEEVLDFHISDYTNQTIGAATYGINTLYVLQTTDENNNLMWTYTDKDGKVILKRSEISEGEYADTYYVYDDFENLVLVIPPEGVKQMGMNYGLLNVSDFQAKWLFKYRYDYRQRLIEKQVPGALPTYMVYDNRDRLVLIQDGNQRCCHPEALAGETAWTFTKYDALNRPIMTGVMTSTLNRDELESAINSLSLYESFSAGAGNYQYTDDAFPQAAQIVEHLTVTYYDDYDFVPGSTLSGRDYIRPVEFIEDDAFHLLPERNINVKPQVTGSVTNLLDTDEFLTTISFYDDRYRVIQMVSENHIGGTDVMSNQYDFIGNVRRVKSVHSDGNTETSILMHYDYDHADRLLSATHSINDVTPVVLYTNEYNELGELTGKQLHVDESDGSYAQAIEYEYNIRGWLRTINESGLSDSGEEPKPSSFFSLELIYNTDITNLSAN